MNRPRPKRSGVRLQGDEYVRLGREVFERDNWRCELWKDKRAADSSYSISEQFG